MDDELLDLVDKDDNVIGTINRMDYGRLVADNLGYIRASQFFLLNSEGKIYIPIRTAHKTIAPNGYDYTAGGHVGAGDSYVQAMIREAEEELSLDLRPDDLELVAKVVEEDIRYINSIYVVRSDQTPSLNPEDFVSGEWLKPADVIAKIDAGHPTKSSLRRAIVLLQEYIQRD
jgi:isopentenyldiphosphate isomerase